MICLAYVLVVFSFVLAMEIRRRRPVNRYFIEGKRVSKEEYDQGFEFRKKPTSPRKTIR
jgi:hypothetical protein